MTAFSHTLSGAVTDNQLQSFNGTTDGHFLMQGMTTGYVRWILRLEGLAMLAMAVAAYSQYGMGWKVFFIYFLLPDVGFIGYLLGPQVGAVTYNLTHSSVGPVVCLLVALITASPVTIAIGLIWLAHIGFDRALGYGLKYSQGFRFTHLGLIGRTRDNPTNPELSQLRA